MHEWCYLLFFNCAATYGIPEEIPISKPTNQQAHDGNHHALGRSSLRIKHVPPSFYRSGAKPDGSTYKDHGPEPISFADRQAAQGKRRRSPFGDDYQTPDGN